MVRRLNWFGGACHPQHKSTLSVCDNQGIPTNYRIAFITPIIRVERDSLRTAFSEAASAVQTQLCVDARQAYSAFRIDTVPASLSFN